MSKIKEKLLYDEMIYFVKRMIWSKNKEYHMKISEVLCFLVKEDWIFNDHYSLKIS